MQPRRLKTIFLAVAVVATAASASAVAASPSPTLSAVLDAHQAMLRASKIVTPRTFATVGTLDGLGLHGTFATWHDGDRERYDQTLGIRVQRTLRLGGREFIQNENGDVRELRGLAARRQVTEDFIDSGEFARHPEYDELLGPARLHDGRDVWQIKTDPPGGEPYLVSLDSRTSMVDEKAFREGDGIETIDYSDFRISHGALYPMVASQSNGDRAFDITSHTTGVRIDEPIDPAVFAPLNATVVNAASPVIAPLLFSEGHLFVRATASGKPLLLLLDTGSQGVFVDTDAARRLGLVPQGTLEVRGAARTRGAGVAALDSMTIAGVNFPVRVVSIIDLQAVTYRGVKVDGVLGYPFFAAADVRIDPDGLTMTIAKPGGLPRRGIGIDVDTDRQLPEIPARINDRLDGRFLVDTGNSNELLLFHGFVTAHPGVIFYGAAQNFAQNRGVGGSSAAVPTVIDRLQFGPFTFYNRYADVILTATGAFADQNEAGNIGLGTLRNFIFTFDLSNRRLYLERARTFDDGRYRPRYEPGIP